MPLGFLTTNSRSGTRAEMLPLVQATRPLRVSSRCSSATVRRRSASALNARPPAALAAATPGARSRLDLAARALADRLPRAPQLAQIGRGHVRTPGTYAY